MRALFPVLSLIVAGTAVFATNVADAHDQDADSKSRCAGFGFTPGTDAFANCVMKLSMKQQRDHPDHDTLVRRYRDSSMARRGDSRYPVCSAGMMENELDTSIGKWVGPNCQMAPD